MLLFVGLGNPGAKHAANRHNIGFMAVDAIAEAHGFGPWRGKFQAEISEGRLGGDKLLLLKPQTFMNLSGQAVGEAMRFLKLDPTDIWVFHDELDLAPGRLRLKSGGGHAGHNGLRSLIQHVGPEFHRVRLGIGHPGHRDLVTHYVLQDFAKADRDWLAPLLDAVGRAAGKLAAGDGAGFMNAVALATRPPPPRKARPQPAEQSTAQPDPQPTAQPNPATTDPSAEPGNGGLQSALGRWVAKFGRS